MTPSERRMPIIDATWDELRRGWLLTLPDGNALVVRDTAEAELVVSKHAPGSSIRYSRRTK